MIANKKKLCVDHGFESHRGHEYLSAVCVLSGRGLYDELITRPEESYRLWRVVVCERGGLSPRSAAKPEVIIIIIIITRVIPVIIGTTGTISKSFRKYVSTIPGNHEVKELQKTAILGTAHILRKVLM
jgi:hypothetical protein